MAPMTAVWPADGSLAAPSAEVPALPGASEVVVSQTVKDLTAGTGLATKMPVSPNQRESPTAGRSSA